MAVACVTSSFAHGQPQTNALNFSAYRPFARAAAIAPSQAPKVDGDLSDPAWATAEPIRDFFQIEPNIGAPASERTEIRILHDADTLFIAVHAYDRDPHRITARLKQRDADLTNDDAIRFYLDPNMTRRNAFIFQVNPNGARREGLLQNNLVTLYEWNTIWSAKTRRVADGWTAEIAIPFRSISYDRHSQWGLDIDREIRRKNEVVRWSSIDRATTANNVSRAGTLQGMDGIRGAGSLDVQAFALTRYIKNWDSKAGTGVSFRPSGNLFYKVTPSLTGTLTYNTDFSDAPLDQRQVNISRYSLFYPERRDFFLQDASAFEFGGRALAVADDANGAPFFSRRIGIVNDETVNILGGAKLSGDYGGIGVGAMTVTTARGGGVGPQTLTVARLSTPVLDESKLGLVVTHGDPTGASDNTVMGGDFQYRTTSLFGGQTLRADAYFERSFSNLSGDGNSFGLALDLPNEPWNVFFAVKQVDGNFDPALGFVARPATRSYKNITKYRERFDDSWLRWIEFCLWGWYETDLSNHPDSRFFGGYVSATSEAGDFFQLEGKFDNEIVGKPFFLPHAIKIDAGEYNIAIAHAAFESSPARLVSTKLDIEYSGFYGGTMLQTTSALTFNPNETVSFGITHIMQQISVTTGKVAIQVLGVDTSLNITPDMQVRGQVQYDNISRNLQVSMRYRWEFQPGSELLIVAGDEATYTYPYYRSHSSQLSVRLSKTIQL